MDFLLRSDRLLLANRLLLAAVIVPLLSLLTPATSAAQTLKASGTLEGTVSDTAGGRIPGVEVNLRQIATNQIRVVASDDEGFFRATGLPVGTYEVRVEHTLASHPTCTPASSLG